MKDLQVNVLSHKFIRVILVQADTMLSAPTFSNVLRSKTQSQIITPLEERTFPSTPRYPPMSDNHLKAGILALELDETLYNLNNEQKDFLKRTARIDNDEELRKHVLEVQADAYKVFPYPCIRYFTFAKLAITHLPNYQQILKLPQARPGAILLDMGCCFGSDLRKAVFDGWPAKDTVACDLFDGLWEHGHKLYRTTPAMFPAGFVAGDAFNEDITSLQEPCYSLPPENRPESLTSLKSLIPLRGHVDAIHTSLFFHLFDEEKQLELARRLAALLSPMPSSVIFGGHYARAEKGLKTEILGNGKEHIVFWHSPESWKDMWSGNVFREGTVRVDVVWSEEESHFTELQQSGKLYYLKWCVTRL